MADMEKTLEMYQAGFNCGQVVATLCSEHCGYDEKLARAAMGGFGGGLRCGETCGAVAGGVYALGMYCNHCEYDDKLTRRKIIEMTKKYTDEFKEKYGALCCRELSPKKDLERCAQYIASSVEIVEKLVDEDRAKTENP
ncbi:MAG: C-GCAxxG-C-C family protein [Oscillospiraceae bacterium]